MTCQGSNIGSMKKPYILSGKTKVMYSSEELDRNSIGTNRYASTFHH